MAAAYLEQYFDCVEALPLDLQKCVTRLREIEKETEDLCGKIERARLDFLAAVRSGDGDRQKILFRELQQCMLDAREVGNVKLEISAQLLDIAGDYTQKLGQRAKDMENQPRSEDPYHSPRYMHNSTKGESPLTVLSNGVSESKPPGKKNTGTKRPRQVDKSHVHNNEEEPPQPSGGVAKESNSGRGKETNNSSSSSSVKPPKKKVKTIKKKSATTSKEKESSSSSSSSQVHMPMPDLTSKPLDPNEPTYCLCQQVSFGEMIGCDNDDCPIEWFHFQCVGLTSKPKGKWYCPQCSQERRSSRTSK